MKLNHLNLTVTDVRAVHTFLQTYFDLQPLGRANENMAFLTDENGMVLSMFRGENVVYTDTFHVGFIQPSKESVNAINRRLEADGFDVPAPSQQHGSWTFYFEAPGGFTIEVLC